MAELKMRNIFALVLVCSFFVGLFMEFSGAGLMEKASILDPFAYTYEFGTEITLNVGDKIYYEKGFVQADALYCGFGGENMYAILQTDAVSNPQKIIVGKTVNISNIEFIVLEKSCLNDEKLITLAKKE